jgi:hypothetical protein
VVIEVLAADAGVAMGVCIVISAQDAGVRDVIWKEIAEPVHIIRGRPRLVTVSIQAVDGDNAEGNVRIRYCSRQDQLT